MENLNDVISMATKDLICQEHNKKPEITFNGDKIIHNCCCEKFRSEISEIVKTVSHEFVMKAFNNLGKD